jgi:UDP-sugar transporter A1/2/3
MKSALVSWDRTLRAWCLALIVVQNSSLILVTSYSRTLKPAYLATVAVFFAECLKLVGAIVLLACEVRSPRVALVQVASLLCENGSSTMLFAVPAICYTLQNNLWYYALSHLDPVTAAVTSQMKIITTAVATVVMLGRRLTWLQWCALFGLMCGLVVIQWGSQHEQQTARVAEATGGKDGLTTPKNSVGGALAMMLATILSAYSGVFLERLFKTVKLTLWLQSIQLSVFALPVAFLTMCAYDHRALRNGRLMVGFNDVVWIAVSLNAVGGIAVSMALKYADNILKVRPCSLKQHNKCRDGGKRGRKADGWIQRRGLDCGQFRRGRGHRCLDGAEVCGQYS